MKKNPAISVIIPLYNAEKYISKCLESVLAQSFQDFEVIVVDDCSTDNSVSIAEDYAPRFEGRLTLTRTKKNSGGGGYIPRNIGLNFSRGKYIFFLDADDFIVETALEILYEAATQFNADVVYTSRYYSYDFNDKILCIGDQESFKNGKDGIEKSITLTIDDPNKNLYKLLMENGNFRNPWTKFVERKFLIENEIVFPKIISGGDFIWTIEVLYYAKRFLRLPVALYFYTKNSESVTRKEQIPDKKIIDTTKAFLMGASALSDLSNKITLLKQDKNYLHFAIGAFFYNCLERNFKARKQISYVKVYDILCKGLSEKTTTFDLIVSFLLSVIDLEQKLLLESQQRIAELENKLKIGSDL